MLQEETIPIIEIKQHNNIPNCGHCYQTNALSISQLLTRNRYTSTGLKRIITVVILRLCILWDNVLYKILVNVLGVDWPYIIDFS